MHHEGDLSGNFYVAHKDSQEGVPWLLNREFQ
ncbi:protein of unknown function [Paraburkholderia dioscoreae]|uniref:Uncharacterized protein n=1 Tax=Paraburkholderia dioscoreae TaxID=2604047 RepID=A0A5Q4YUC4_9BURK|nr:protein of unknown function [Paraburkholderia dioscoreae]